MTIQRIEREITTRIDYLIEKKDGLIVREMSPKRMRQLQDEYEKEIDALCAARRAIGKFYSSR